MKQVFLAIGLVMVPLGLIAEDKKPKIAVEMPPGVHESKGPNGSFRYEFRDIYTQFLPKGYETNEKVEEALTGGLRAGLAISNMVSLDVDLEKKTCALVSPKKLTLKELREVLGLVVGGRVVPSWYELRAREFAKSKEFRVDLFVANKAEIKNFESLKWSEGRRFKPLKLPLQIGNGQLGSLELTPTARLSMSYGYFTMRVFDQRGDVVWKGADDLLKGIVRVSLIDSDGDGWQEILVACEFAGDDEKVVRVSYQEKKK